MQFFHHPLPSAQKDPKPSICILARKNLTRNTRVVRQAKTLSEAGFRVTVVAVELPHPEVRALAPDVTYVQVLSKPKLIEFLRWAYVSAQSNSIRTDGFDMPRLSRLETFFCASLVVLVLQILQAFNPGRVRSVCRKIKARAVIHFRIRVFIGPREVWSSTLRYIASRAKLLFRKIWFLILLLSGAVSRHYDSSGITDKPGPNDKETELSARKGPLSLPAKQVPIPRDFMARMKQFVLGNWRPRISETNHNAVNEPSKDLKELIFSVSMATKTIYFAWSADRVLKGTRFDYYQAHDSYALFAASIVASRDGARLIYDAVEIVDDRSRALNESPGWLKAWEKRRDEAIVRRADLVTAVGTEVAQWTGDRYAISMPVVIRNCSLFIEEPQANHGGLHTSLLLEKQDRLALIVGNVYPGQGVEKLIESMPYLDPFTHVAVMGYDTPRGYFDDLKKLTAKLNMADRFHVLDPCPPHMVSTVAAEADIGVVFLQKTSLNHLYALPNKLFEYIMARLPVASARLPGIETILNKYGIGMVFDEEDERNIAEVINTLLMPGNLDMMKDRVRKAAHELCWEQEGQRYVEVIKKLGNGDGVGSLATR